MPISIENEARDWHGRWTTNGTGSATNHASQTEPAISDHQTRDRARALDGAAKPKTSAAEAETKAAPTAPESAAANAPSTKGSHWKSAKSTRIAGIVFNETSGIYPALKPGAQPGGQANWDAASRDALNKAREHIAEVANAGKRSVAKPAIPNPKNLTPVEESQWRDCQTAASAAGGKTSKDNFIIWPSDDNGRTPTHNPPLRAEWPYDYSGHIEKSYGPFRVPKKAGDVPAGNNIYIFFFKDVP